MINEDIINEDSAKDHVCSKNETTSTKVITKNNEEIFTQIKFNSFNRIDDGNLNFPVTMKPKVTKKTSRTYTRKTIRKIGPNGEVTEEVIEEGDDPNKDLQSELSKFSNDKNGNIMLCGKSKIQAEYGYQTVSESGENNTEVHCMEPVEILHNDENVNESFPAGATVIKSLKTERSYSITHSTKIDGLEKLISSKSGFQNVTAESNFKVKSKNTEDSSQKASNENIIKSDENVNKPEINEENIHSKNDQEPTMRIIELSKILDFSQVNKNSTINILSKKLIKEGETIASESSQKFSGVLKKLVKKKQIKFHLIVLNDLVFLTNVVNSAKYIVIEYWEKNKVQASIIENSSQNKNVLQRSKSNKGKKSLLSCVSSKRSLPDIRTEYQFILKYPIENSNLLEESLILHVYSEESRNSWINALSTF